MAKNKGKLVYVGMSGGVDSSVSAALLKEQGYFVVGVFIKAWEPAGYDCGWRDERRDAMRVAAHLGIPFLTLDLSKEYKQKVVDYVIAEYRAGRTPNPDVMCNQTIKFGAFYDRARKAGADFVATGHYTRIGVIPVKTGIQFQMLAGADKNKDQSYFLWTLKPEQLAHTLFPIGELEKPAVRKLATKSGLPVAEKKDSQGLCFVGKLDLKDFLRASIKEKSGAVLNEAGAVIGEHPGALLFTLGERHGFTVFQKTPAEAPLYVIKKDLPANTLTVGPGKSLIVQGKKEVSLDRVSFTASEPIIGKKYLARVRYRQPLQECRLEKTKMGDWTVIFAEPQTVAPGQSLVIYDGEVCLGGGIIK